jgi:xylulokinase
LLAAVGAGVFPSVERASAAAVQVTDRTRPDREAAAVYAGFYPQYRALYPALRKEFRAVSRLVAGGRR